MNVFCKIMKEVLHSRIKGSLVAGAAGDALGYTVEFMKYPYIINNFGEKGITEYQLNENGIAKISDDTQMTLFTAVGLVDGLHKGDGSDPLNLSESVKEAYIEWFNMQMQNNVKIKCWLGDVKEMGIPRIPGLTCIGSLELLAKGETPDNNSCGCGGVMRIAPVALLAAAVNTSGKYPPWKSEDIIKLGVATSHLTHLSPVADFAAGMLTYLLYSIVISKEKVTAKKIKNIIKEAKDMISKLSDPKTGKPYSKSQKGSLKSFFNLVDKGIKLSSSKTSDVKAISSIGEGWRGDEAFVIALYCSVKHINDIESALIASVNHSGDSDSTGCITGHIMGLICGYENIPDKFKKNLEILDIIEKVADNIMI